MNKYKIIWSPKARKDLLNIYTYIKDCLKERYIANNITKKISNSISNLHYFPERYSKIFYFKDKTKNIRKLSIDNYIILYEIDDIFRESLHSTYIQL